MELEFFASCIGGLEATLAEELKSLGIDRVRPLSGGVAFFCEAHLAYAACMWSRLASRILLVLGRVNAGDSELLYAGVYDMEWENMLADGATFAVRAHGTNAELRNTRFTALKVKDALADRLQSRRRRRPDVDAVAPRAAIDVRLHDRRATISLDFSGEALNHRGYLLPDDKKDAPLECSLAAGALALAGIRNPSTCPQSFVDPACRDGILLVEATSIACDRAPGLGRKRWGFEGWALFDERRWREITHEAQQRFETGMQDMTGLEGPHQNDASRPNLDRVRYVGASISSPSIARAREHVKRAGLRQAVSVEIADAAGVGELVARVEGIARKGSRGGESGHAEQTCVVASDFDSQSREDARAYLHADEAAFIAAVNATKGHVRSIAIASADIATRFGQEGHVRHSLGQGRVKTEVDVFEGRPEKGAVVEIADLSGGSSHMVEVLEKASEQFAARLRKVFKERRKWAGREGITCFRIYDSDLPDYAVAIDWYAGAGEARANDYLHIAEYAPPSSVDAEKARRRFSDVLAIAPVVCGIRPDHVFSKRRMRQKGGSQYRNAGHRAYRTTVEEGGFRFEVDLAGRLDTGLFLDHRDTRKLIAEKAQGARFLNLFAYTGSATVYAAGGGASSTTTVDLSQTYLDWARRNMSANGLTGDEHEFVRADVMRWITEARRSGKRYDLVFVDPPTFSNSKAMGKKTWDVQRDHVELLIGVTRLLSKNGEALFSCNLRSFKPYLDDLAKYGVGIEDISASTIPYDFKRTPKIHKCFRVWRQGQGR